MLFNETDPLGNVKELYEYMKARNWQSKLWKEPWRTPLAKEEVSSKTMGGHMNSLLLEILQTK